jgi:hypothetical protein
MVNEIVVSETGEVLHPPLHDARLQGVVLASDDRLLLFIDTIDRKQRCLVLGGIERLRADDFRNGNIILDVTVSSGASIAPNDIAYAYGLSVSDALVLDKVVRRLIAEKMLVIRLNPSYGCELVCICQSIQVDYTVVHP